MKALDYFCVLYDSLFVFIIIIDWDSCVGNDPNDTKKSMHKFGVIVFFINYITRVIYISIKAIKLFLIHRCSEIYEKNT